MSGVIEKQKVNRVVLSPETMDRLGKWLLDVRGSYRGIRIRPKDIVDWLVASHSERLSAAEKKSLKERYFDDVAQAEWVLKELRGARSDGKELTLKELLSNWKPRGEGEERKEVEYDGN